MMKAEGTHEGCIEQIYGLFSNSLYNDTPMLDDEGRLRADGKELEPHVQQAVEALWNDVTTENVQEISDFSGYQKEFLNLFGFEMEGVDYDADVNPEQPIANCN